METADAIVVGGGLAGLVAATELTDAGKRVILVEQEGEQNLGGQAFWSFGGLFLVDSPEQRRLGIRDSHDLAWQDWLGAAGFDRDEDIWPKRWAQAYVAFAAGEKRDWLRAMGHRIFPVVGWAERGGRGAMEHGNSVPRFHGTWGGGPGSVEPLERRNLLAINVFPVNDFTGTGTGTLSWAITQANSTPNDPAGPDKIVFELSGATRTIALQEPLPAITEAVVIDGFD